MLQKLIEFFTFSEPNIKYVVIGSVLLAGSAAIVGTFAFLRKKSLVGDAVAHSVLPGVCIAFMLIGEKNPLALVIGAFVSGWISLLFIDWVVKNSKIKEDSAIGITLSVFFGLGILLLTNIQHSGNASQSGLDHFLFGSAASLIGEDLYLFAGIAALLVLIVFMFFKEFTLISFDANFAESLGLPVKKLDLLLTTLTVLAVVVGIQAVGVVLMAAMLITPVAAARFWTENIRVLVVLSAAFGAFSGVGGAFVSYVEVSMPTGPWIVLIVSIIAIFSFFFAPGKGIMSRWLQQRKNRRQMLEENILKAFYQIGEKEKQFFSPKNAESILQKRHFTKEELGKGLGGLVGLGYLSKSPQGWAFTKEGYEKGRRVTKLHRLWELYLTEIVNIAPDHVHEDAETMEHIITPELEKALEQRLQFPKVDPHSSEIPYSE